MKILFCAVGVAAAIGFTSASAQAPASTDSIPDFSGVYIGSPQIVQPDDYPLTPDGKSVQDVFDPLAVGPWAHDDCAVENFPALLWAGTVSNMQLIPSRRSH